MIDDTTELVLYGLLFIALVMLIIKVTYDEKR